jgi:multiple sugar transport system substrate-binding protein
LSVPHVFVLVVTALAVGALCLDRPYAAPHAADEVVIDYWEKWTGFEAEAMKATIARFNERKIRNGDGKVIVCRYLSTTQIERKALMSIAGGNPPDLVGLWSRNVHVFAEMGALRPLDDFVAADGVDFDAYMPIYRDGCRYRPVGAVKDSVWCLPTTPVALALHWNKELFRAAGLDPERPPRTIAELEEFSERLTLRDQTGRITQIGFLPSEPGKWNWGWGYFFGGKLNDGPDRLTADDPANVRALEWYCSFGKKYDSKVLQSFSQGFGSSDSPQNSFISGKVAMVLQGVWMANFIHFHNPNLEWSCAPFPSGFADEGQPVTIAEMDTISIPAGSRHPREAWQVIRFINARENMEYLCGARENNGGQGKFTAFKETTPGWLEQHPHPRLGVFVDLAGSKHAITDPQLIVWDEYLGELVSAYERAWLGKATPAEALHDVQVRMQPKLDHAIALQRARRSRAQAR